MQECASSFGSEVTRESIDFLMPQIFRSYDMRMTLAGDKREGSSPEPNPSRRA